MFDKFVFVVQASTWIERFLDINPVRTAGKSRPCRLKVVKKYGTTLWQHLPTSFVIPRARDTTQRDTPDANPEDPTSTFLPVRRHDLARRNRASQRVPSSRTVLRRRYYFTQVSEEAVANNFFFRTSEFGFGQVHILGSPPDFQKHHW